MGVMQCNRKGCDNILCNKYSSYYGYICEHCFDDLKKFVISRVRMGSYDVPQMVKTFMETPKHSDLNYEGAIERLLEDMFTPATDTETDECNYIVEEILANCRRDTCY